MSTNTIFIPWDVFGHLVYSINVEGIQKFTQTLTPTKMNAGEGESVQMSHYRQMVSGKFPLLQSKWIDARDSGIGKAFRVKNLSGSMVISMGTSGEDSQIVDINTMKVDLWSRTEKEGLG